MPRESFEISEKTRNPLIAPIGSGGIAMGKII
jgi:hypothetical protein